MRTTKLTAALPTTIIIAVAARGECHTAILSLRVWNAVVLPRLVLPYRTTSLLPQVKTLQGSTQALLSRATDKMPTQASKQLKEETFVRLNPSTNQPVATVDTPITLQQTSTPSSTTIKGKRNKVRLLNHPRMANKTSQLSNRCCMASSDSE